MFFFLVICFRIVRLCTCQSIGLGCLGVVMSVIYKENSQYIEIILHRPAKLNALDTTMLTQLLVGWVILRGPASGSACS